MTTAFLGIVTRRGLELFCREEEHTARFLQRRLRQSYPLRAGCVWFVADSRVDSLLHELIARGQFEAAWTVVEQYARDRGVLLPDHLEIDEPQLGW